MNGMNEIEAVVERTIRAIISIADRITRYATLLLAAVAVVAVVSFLLGVAALGSGIRTVWIVLGIVFGAIAIGAAFIARWRIGTIRKDVPGLAADVRSLITDGKQNTVAIIDEFQRGDHESAAGSAIVLSRRVYGMRGVIGHGMSGSARLTNAVTAITSFPALAFTAIGITLVFAFLAVVFLLALALS